MQLHCKMHWSKYVCILHFCFNLNIFCLTIYFVKIIEELHRWLAWCLCLCMCMCMCVCLYVHMCACVCVCVCARVWRAFRSDFKSYRYNLVLHKVDFYHFQKMCLAHLHPKANICAKFHENWWKTEEVVRDARFSPNFCHNMPLPWQHTFYHCQKMCLAHLHPKANICAKFHENWWKTDCFQILNYERFSKHYYFTYLDLHNGEYK